MFNKKWYCFQLLYSLKYYKGDDRIKGFIWDLVTMTLTNNGQEQDFRNHSGLSAPVPRGRKGKKAKGQLPQQPGVKPATSSYDQDIAKLDFDPETMLSDEGYKKHLQRHSNK